MNLCFGPVRRISLKRGFDRWIKIFRTYNFKNLILRRNWEKIIIFSIIKNCISRNTRVIYAIFGLKARFSRNINIFFVYDRVLTSNPYLCSRASMERTLSTRFGSNFIFYRGALKLKSTAFHSETSIQRPFLYLFSFKIFVWWRYFEDLLECSAKHTYIQNCNFFLFGQFLHFFQYLW